MIPWATFENGIRNDEPDDVRLQLDEQWLSWIEHGPSMTAMFFESPMLEVAHERQFVVSQQGGDSAGFQTEHTRRMKLCLRQLHNHFSHFAIDEICRPDSPGGIDLVRCWKPNISLDTLPPLAISPETSPSHERQVQEQESANVSSSAFRPLPPPLSATALSLPSKVTTLPPEIASEDDDMSDGTNEQLRESLSSIPRAGATLPIHNSRAPKIVRQRRRYDSKLNARPIQAGQKRNGHQMADKHEDNIAISMRNRSMARCRLVYDHASVHDMAAQVLRREDT